MSLNSCNQIPILFLPKMNQKNPNRRRVITFVQTLL